jgi:hypothetical protein
MLLKIFNVCLFAAVAWMAQPAHASSSPGGIYVIMNATALPSERRQEATVGEALQNPGVDGVLIHLRWNEISPARGRFDWSVLDRATQLAMAARKRFEIGIVTGAALPAWITDPPPAGLGAAHASFSYNAAMANGCNTMVLPAPYDAAYLGAFRGMLHELAAHLRGTGAYANLSMLKLVGITTTTNELRLPSLAQCGGDAVKTWQSLGYTPAKVRGAWGEMLKAYLDNFPDKSFNIGYIGINAFPGIKGDGSAAATPKEAAALSEQFTAALIADAATVMPGRLALGFDSLTLNLLPKDSSYVRYIEAFYTAGANVKLGWQTNELLQQAGGAACGGGTPANAVPCANSGEFLAMLLRGIYPQGEDSTPPDRQGVYLELFPQNINAYPDAVREAHRNLAQWNGAP